MFRRRTPLSWPQRVRESLYPKKGFSRLYSYGVQRVLRLPDSPYSLACGLASGIAVSFTPLIGLHLLLALLLAYVLRGNLLTAGIGTLVNNPWTFPFILVFLDRFGTLILSHFYGAAPFHLRPDETVYDKIMAYFIPIALGGAVFSVLAWGISFALCYWGIVSWRKHKARRIK